MVVGLDQGMGFAGDAAGDVLFNVENIIGSVHGDSLIGHDGANRIEGGAGNDHIEGRAGNDVLAGGAGGDTLDGGDGFDAAIYTESASGVTVDLANGRGNGGDAEGDRLVNIEDVTGSAHDDVIRGNGGTNRLDGGAGDDLVSGGGGDDWLEGGTGSDTLWGDGGNDMLIGGSGNDVLDGGDGDDILVGGAGADVFKGGSGDDMASYAGSNAGVSVDMETGAMSGGHADGDRFEEGIDGLIGSDHADALLGNQHYNQLEGGAGNDLLEGRGGQDTLLGGAGDDRLDGGTGNDWLQGGEGQDTFAFAADGGHDTIADFEEGDRIELDAASFARLDSALAEAVQQGNDVVVDFDGSAITFANTRLESITTNDFHLAS